MNDLSILPNGTILRGIYRIDRFLSSGGFGNTYAATNIEFDEQVAVKEFFLKGKTERDGDTSSVTVSNPESQQEFFQQLDKFKKEARRIRRLQNDHIIKVHDLFEENGTAYYVMDYIDGESLSDRMKRTGKPMTENEVLEILPQILEGLKSVHDISVWHMDLKPSNIMIDKKGKVTIIDFGASKHIEQGKSLTTSMAVGKTVAYCPPEQTQETLKNVGPWTDIYSLGATLYSLLTRNTPPSFDDILNEGKEAFYFPASVSDNLQKLIIWMMKPNRKERPQNIEEIEAYLSSNKETAYSSTSPHKVEDENTIYEQEEDNSEETVLQDYEKKDSPEETDFEGDDEIDEEGDESLDSVRIDFFPLTSRMKFRVYVAVVMALIGAVFYYGDIVVDNTITIPPSFWNSSVNYYADQYRIGIVFFLITGASSLAGHLLGGLKILEHGDQYAIYIPLVFLSISCLYDLFFESGIISAILDYLWIGSYLLLTGFILTIEYKGKIRIMTSFFIVHALFLLMHRIAFDFPSSILFSGYWLYDVHYCLRILMICIVSWMLLQPKPEDFYGETFEDGSKYVGYHENGTMEGWGTCYFVKGEAKFYIGRFKNGYFAGEGKMYFKDGSRYEGEFKHDYFSGKGTYLL